MKEFDLKKYLAEGKLLKESIDVAYFWGHDDYENFYLSSKSEYDQEVKDDGEPDTVKMIPPAKVNYIHWNDEFIRVDSYNSIDEFLDETSDDFGGNINTAEEIINDSYPDGSSSNGEVLLIDGKVVAKSSAVKIK